MTKILECQTNFWLGYNTVGLNYLQLVQFWMNFHLIKYKTAVVWNEYSVKFQWNRSNGWWRPDQSVQFDPAAGIGHGTRVKLVDFKWKNDSIRRDFINLWSFLDNGPQLQRIGPAAGIAFRPAVEAESRFKPRANSFVWWTNSLSLIPLISGRLSFCSRWHISGGWWPTAGWASPRGRCHMEATEFQADGTRRCWAGWCQPWLNQNETV